MVVARARDICSTAEVREATTEELWRQICHEICLEVCAPWVGYPHSLLPAEAGFWTHLALRADDNVRRRVRGLQELMLACLGPSTSH
jgi:hypothetical protein